MWSAQPPWSVHDLPKDLERLPVLFDAEARSLRIPVVAMPHSRLRLAAPVADCGEKSRGPSEIAIPRPSGSLSTSARPTGRRADRVHERRVLLGVGDLGLVTMASHMSRSSLYSRAWRRSAVPLPPARVRQSPHQLRPEKSRIVADRLPLPPSQSSRIPRLVSVVLAFFHTTPASELITMLSARCFFFRLRPSLSDYLLALFVVLLVFVFFLSIVSLACGRTARRRPARPWPRPVRWPRPGGVRLSPRAASAVPRRIRGWCRGAGKRVLRRRPPPLALRVSVEVPSPRRRCRPPISDFVRRSPPPMRDETRLANTDSERAAACSVLSAYVRYLPAIAARTSAGAGAGTAGAGVQQVELVLQPAEDRLGDRA